MPLTQNTNLVRFGDLSREYRALKTEIDSAVSRVLSRGSYILGPELEAFESSFASYIQASDCVGVASGTDAIALALRACGVGPQDEVITVAYTAPPTAMAIAMIGAVPRFVDIEPGTCLMDISKIEKAITPKTKAIVPVHIYGQCVDMDPLMKIARKAGLRVIEDCAHAHGAVYKGKKAGTLSDASAFSFYPTKNLGCYGDGGAVVTRDAQVAAQTRLLRNYGLRERGSYTLLGVNSRLDELQAAILSVKLPHLDSWNVRRRQIALTYNRGLKGLPVELPVEAPERLAVYHLYVLHTDQRDRLIKELKQSSVEASDHYAFPSHRLEAFQTLGYKAGSLPVTERYAAQALSLPVHPFLTDDEINQVVKAMKGCLSR